MASSTSWCIDLPDTVNVWYRLQTSLATIIPNNGLNRSYSLEIKEAQGLKLEEFHTWQA
jgi:hypothetical protein